MPLRSHTLPDGTAIAQQDSDYVLIGSPDSNWSQDYANIVDYLTESDMPVFSMGVGDSPDGPSVSQLIMTDSDIFSGRTVHDMRFGAGGGGVSQDLLDSANTLVSTLRSLLDSAENALAGASSTSVQRWIT